MTTPFQQRLSKEQAMQKLKHYCAYQERCHQEVKEKLYSFGLYKNEVEELMANLIEENYLNEERFAIQFAGGRFRMKQWGRVKIRHALQQKQVSEYCIKKALQQIDDDSYRKTLEKTAAQKWKTLGTEKNKFAKKQKLYDYLLQKGFEGEAIREAVAGLQENE